MSTRGSPENGVEEDARDAGFEFVEHTADLAIRAWGPRMEDAFARAARGLMEYVVDVPERADAVTFDLDVSADTPERLLFRFLDEVLFLHQTELVVFAEFRVTIVPPTKPDAPWRLTAKAHGEPWSDATHGHVHEIKAVTYHDIRVLHEPRPEVYVIVDI